MISICSKLRVLIALSIVALLLQGCEKSTFLCSSPYRTGPNCDICDTAGGARLMGRNNDLCLSYDPQILDYIATNQARGGIGWYFVVFREPVDIFFSDSMILGPQYDRNVELTTPGDTIWEWSSFVTFGEAYSLEDNYYAEPGCIGWSHQGNIPRRYAGGFETTSQDLFFDAGDEWSLTWWDVDWDQDCEIEIARVFGNFTSSTEGEGYLLWFERLPDDTYEIQDTLYFDVIPFPENWQS